MKIKYIYHSGFLIETEANILIFDYYKGELPLPDKKKRITFFVSHKHEDHFNPEIFHIGKHYDHVTYVLGSGMKLSERYMDRIGIDESERAKIIHMKKHENLELDGIKIETLRSTDAGVAFLVCVENIWIYFAGDLNWWHWEGESEEFNNNMKTRYLEEMSKLKNRKFDISFIPYDPRLEKAKGMGILEFLNNASTSLLIPMHMYEKYEIIEDLKKELKQNKKETEVFEIQYEGQELIWKL